MHFFQFVLLLILGVTEGQGLDFPPVAYGSLIQPNLQLQHNVGSAIHEHQQLHPPTFQQRAYNTNPVPEILHMPQIHSQSYSSPIMYLPDQQDYGYFVAQHQESSSVYPPAQQHHVLPPIHNYGTIVFQHPNSQFHQNNGQHPVHRQQGFAYQMPQQNNGSPSVEQSRPFSQQSYKSPSKSHMVSSGNYPQISGLHFSYGQHISAQPNDAQTIPQIRSGYTQQPLSGDLRQMAEISNEYNHQTFHLPQRIATTQPGYVEHPSSASSPYQKKTISAPPVYTHEESSAGYIHDSEAAQFDYGRPLVSTSTTTTRQRQELKSRGSEHDERRTSPSNNMQPTQTILPDYGQHRSLTSGNLKQTSPPQTQTHPLSAPQFQPQPFSRGYGKQILSQSGSARHPAGPTSGHQRQMATLTGDIRIDLPQIMHSQPALSVFGNMEQTIKPSSGYAQQNEVPSKNLLPTLETPSGYDQQQLSQPRKMLQTQGAQAAYAKQILVHDGDVQDSNSQPSDYAQLPPSVSESNKRQTPAVLSTKSQKTSTSLGTVEQASAEVSDYKLPHPAGNGYDSSEAVPPDVAVRSFEQIIRGSEENNYQFSSDHGISQSDLTSFTEDKGLVKQGSYSYSSPEGVPIKLKWVADSNGFHPEGDHLPTSPPMPAEIAAKMHIHHTKFDHKYQERIPSTSTPLQSSPIIEEAGAYDQPISSKPVQTPSPPPYQSSPLLLQIKDQSVPATDDMLVSVEPHEPVHHQDKSHAQLSGYSTTEQSHIQQVTNQTESSVASSQQPGVEFYDQANATATKPIMPFQAAFDPAVGYGDATPLFHTHLDTATGDDQSVPTALDQPAIFGPSSNYDEPESSPPSQAATIASPINQSEPTNQEPPGTAYSKPEPLPSNLTTRPEIVQQDLLGSTPVPTSSPTKSPTTLLHNPRQSTSRAGRSYALEKSASKAFTDSVQSDQAASSSLFVEKGGNSGC